MGINGGHTVTFGLHNLNFQHLLLIAHKRHTDAVKAKSDNRKQSIYIDASWVCRKFAAVSGGPIAAIIKITITFAREGLHIVLVCDGAICHDSKRGSVQRQSDRERTRIKAHSQRAEII